MLSLNLPLAIFVLCLSLVTMTINTEQRDNKVSDNQAFIVFTSNVDYRNSDANSYAIYQVQPDGVGFRQLTSVTSSRGLVYSIRGVDCHLDTQQLVIATDFEYEPYLYIMNFDGSNLHQDLEVKGAVQDVSFSPDGHRIVLSSRWTFYSRELEFDESLYIADLQNQSYESLLRDVGTAYHSPQWSPDGSKIAYSYHPEYGMDYHDKHGIGIIDADNSNNHNIIESTAWIGHPAWSPDGQYIVFAMEENDFKNIYVMRSDGTERVQLTNESSNNIRPRWSPDGNWISFSSDRNEERYQIYVMDRRGNNVRQITNNLGDNYNQCWMLTAQG
jgi:Tol biopolymer transport system component